MVLYVIFAPALDNPPPQAGDQKQAANATISVSADLKIVRSCVAPATDGQRSRPPGRPIGSAHRHDDMAPIAEATAFPSDRVEDAARRLAVTKLQPPPPRPFKT